jgi:fibronectin type 3 domain-containing protein
VAPTGLTASTIGTTTIDLTWAAVPGASGYRIYRSGASQNVGAAADTTHQVGGLQPGQKYTFTVAAVGVGSKVGPKSSGVAVTTKTVSMKAPTSLKASNVTKSSVTLNWKAADSASFYRIYVNGVARGTSEDTVHTVGALKPGTKYKIQVKSDSTGGTASAPATVTVTTKRK